MNGHAHRGLRELLDTLERLGYYKYVAPNLVAELKSQYEERVYILSGGNDLHAVFLTDVMYDAIIRSGLLLSNDMPEPVPDVW